ncbi:copper-binding protein [Denitratisoma oestradiolicum]|uniref:Copper-binding protein n=1 Tax=Denitratisoma oestradiolicum TaxID=311182 RepID=A0A6S6XWA4_9PROT|nr:copper-binding protein [Denitratisoma oestradiolicum]TWO78931.1 hypothetical protein CBW56_17385 [Denitratisoma oestradiolicum]CAB1370314.1 conserved exported protein of unknown function [Denitratisoma oestradiolicum]
MKHSLSAAILVVLLAASGHAADGHDVHHAAAAVAEASLSEGTVKKVDKTKGIVTLAHGPLLNLAMDPMTMAFAVKDPAWLLQWKQGNRIRFFADMVKGRLVVMRWEPLP